MNAAKMMVPLAMIFLPQAVSAEGGFSAGVGYATDYIATGFSSSRGKPSVATYVRYDSPLGFAAAAYGAQIEHEGLDDKWELSLYAGYNRQFGKTGLRLSYYRTYMDKFGHTGDEVWIELDRAVTDKLTLGVVYKDDLSGTWSGGPTAVYDFGHGIIGRAIYEVDNYPDGKDTGVIGATKYFENGMSIGAYYNERKFDSGKVLAIIGYDFTF